MENEFVLLSNVTCIQEYSVILRLGTGGPKTAPTTSSWSRVVSLHLWGFLAAVHTFLDVGPI